MFFKGSPQKRYEIIAETISRSDNVLNISYLCKIAGVSRSGFYNWQKRKETRLTAEERDRKDFDLIPAAFQHRGYAKGARGIHMRLLRQNPPVRMNLKKIRRLMKKFNLVCPLRKVNPYRQQAKRLQENRIAPNILNRQFKAGGPRTVLLTDITYIPRYSHHNGTSGSSVLKYTYVSVIMDAFTKEILSCICSTSYKVDFVLETVRQMTEKHGSELKTDTLIHSDQGCQYTSTKFTDILNDAGLRQSMSRRGNCWDNAPQESFFGHMKDEIHVSVCDSHQKIQKAVLDWVEYYNNERYQWSLAKLAPSEYYRFVMTGEYPIPEEVTGSPAPKPPELVDFIFKEDNEYKKDDT